MKLVLGGLGRVKGRFLLPGFGPGLGHHGQFAKAPDAVSTTTLTSEDIQLPTSRMPVARQFDTEWEDPWADERAAKSNPKLQTWGEGEKPEDRYGF